MDNDIYHHPFTVSSKDCTKHKTIKLPNLLDHMQEAAWANATSLGFSTIDLMEKGITWVMNRMRVEIHRLPSHKEHVKVETWPAGMDKYFTKRDFRVWGAQDELLVEATSNWLVMDIVTRKLIAIPEYIHEAKFVTDRNNVPPIADKVKYEQAKTTHTRAVQVSWFDIDLNDHVNNIKYYQWVLDSLGGEYLERHALKKIDITFKHEGKYGDAFVSKSYFDDSQKCWLHSLDHAQSGVAHAIAKSWFE
ncbi:thioesterase [Reichenbachiella carrageenanivorans]|uniref:Thioesterase n=1 Tax=Reichenbachiella carrageenanivorans TaxID=2979869 RepID=A0ABY6CWB5_9BACT|nr:acyl-ACP thioesterase domain-containing protein [Reichenbachiella carrageenanivorans]UXX78211.1 thioesterase [Reichenbachiella carrageenanivorans]